MSTPILNNSKMIEPHRRLSEISLSGVLGPVQLWNRIRNIWKLLLAVVLLLILRRKRKQNQVRDRVEDILSQKEYFNQTISSIGLRPVFIRRFSSPTSRTILERSPLRNRKE